MEKLWYKDAIIYTMDIKCFQDGNGDGVGDFKGATDRLDYLAWLGITCIWLLPFYPSPWRDNGYDVTNYYEVDPRLGTLDDFLDFVHRAGERGIKVIIDLVANHTSDQHPWFQAARRDSNCRYREWYVWSDSPPPYDETPFFPDRELSVWQYDALANAYYYHRFYHFQPDLQLSNPEVQEEILRIMDFWLAMGIAGFRVDAAHIMTSRKGEPGVDPYDQHHLLRRLRELLDKRHPGAVLLGEANVPPAQVPSYFGDGDELNLLFNFLAASYVFLALARQEAKPIHRALNLLPATPDSAQWGVFLRNLDELALDQLPEVKRQQLLEAFAPDPGMRIFGRGIRRRLAPMLDGDCRRILLAFSLLLTLPGTPVIVYGDEIGLGENLELHGRDAVRTPMQWSAGHQGGFSTAPQTWRPVIASGPYGYPVINVQDQTARSGSLLQQVRALLQARRLHWEFGRGDIRFFETGLPGVLLFRSEWKNELLIAVHNLADSACEVSFEVDEIAGRGLRDLVGRGLPDHLGNDRYQVRLDPFDFRWWRASNADG